MLSTFSFLAHKMTWTWTKPWCCGSYWITYFSTLPTTPFLKEYIFAWTIQFYYEIMLHTQLGIISISY
jgi:hypothetical protein